jgi:hemerythrin-like domain-containing protein
LRPLVAEVYGQGSAISAQQVSAVLKHLKIHDDNVHCVHEKKLRRRYVTRAGVKAVEGFVREKPLEAVRVFGSKAAIQKYEQKLSEK